MTYLNTISFDALSSYPRSVQCHCCKLTGATSPSSRFYAYVDPGLEASEDFLIQKIRSIGEKQICETCACIKMHDGTLTLEQLDDQIFITLQNLESQIAQHDLRATADRLLKQNVKSKRLLAKMACIALDHKEFEIAKKFAKELTRGSLSQKDKEWIAPILAELGDVEGLQLLLRAALSEDARDKAFRCAVHGGHTECFKILLDAGVSQSAIDQAVALATHAGDAKSLKIFLDAGASLDVKDQAVYVASYIEYHSAECLELLLNAGVSPSAIDQAATLAFSNPQKETRIEVECLKLLLNAGVCQKTRDDLAEKAAKSNRKECLQILLEAGLSDDGKFFAARSAFDAGHPECLKLVLDKELCQKDLNQIAAGMNAEWVNFECHELVKAKVRGLGASGLDMLATN